MVFVLMLSAVISNYALGQSQPFSNCQMRATPPPLATFGGPATVAPGHTELAVAVGAYGEGLGNGCISDVAGATDWFVRWRRGVTDRVDLGFDALFDDRADGKLEATVKVAMRYQVQEGFRLEGGLGTADGGDGRSINADLAAEIGTSRVDKTWNYYASLRLAGSHGCLNLLCLTGSDQTGPRPASALIPLGVIGSTARVSNDSQFVMEGGLGDILSREPPERSIYYHLSFGMLFRVGGDRP